MGIRTTYPFLALTEPLAGGALVVEGWAPDHALRLAVAEFNRGHYDRLYVTGGPLDQGAPLSEYRTYAELGAAILYKLGLGSNSVQAVPAPAVIQDRTYASAKSLRRWMEANGVPASKLNLMTIGPHARRSRLLFAKVFGDGAVGVVSLPVEDYDAAHWWRSSAGVRTVISEALAYVYARCLFRASEP
jgi:hypothetical protein